ncbi:TPM domain-containing protein [Haloferula rosea]|uniref:TPM domain-containing protein n=1 Tax=Haloferula rosea TaxID=490093 RepID=A0A934VB91_9BACT|nr:hypothetical protein [Haloferula rosea]MBK1827148.1 hypothetical protein [Haloferula rosea]
MKCPRCVQVIHRGAGSCPHCGFSLVDADERFGSEDVRIRRLEDVAGLMRSVERQRVEAAMDRFEQSFPQLFFAVYTGLPEGRSDLRQFGFWLLNRAAFEDVDVSRPNERGILLTIDPDGKAAGMSWGYMLDAFLKEEDTFLCMSRAHAYWVEGRFAEGIVRVLEQLSLVLEKRSRQARRDPESFERKISPPVVRRKVRSLRGKSAKAKERKGAKS